MPSRPSATGVSGSRRTLPFRRTRPARASSAACEREQYPSFESARARPTRRVRAAPILLTSSLNLAASARNSRAKPLHPCRKKAEFIARVDILLPPAFAAIHVSLRRFHKRSLLLPHAFALINGFPMRAVLRGFDGHLHVPRRSPVVYDSFAALLAGNDVASMLDPRIAVHFHARNEWLIALRAARVKFIVPVALVRGVVRVHYERLDGLARPHVAERALQEQMVWGPLTILVPREGAGFSRALLRCAVKCPFAERNIQFLQFRRFRSTTRSCSLRLDVCRRRKKQHARHGNRAADHQKQENAAPHRNPFHTDDTAAALHTGFTSMSSSR